MGEDKSINSLVVLTMSRNAEKMFLECKFLCSCPETKGNSSLSSHLATLKVFYTLHFRTNQLSLNERNLFLLLAALFLISFRTHPVRS